jgi:S-ribosylhomocysteine lyase LuxS involved in autoinducer biosynthesis
LYLLRQDIRGNLKMVQLSPLAYQSTFYSTTRHAFDSVFHDRVQSCLV